jgi:triphosphatase
MIPTEHHPTEIEAKFTVTNPNLLQTLARHPAPVSGYRFSSTVTQELQDIYLDTPDYRLLRHGYELRVRTGAGEWLVTLKSRSIASELGIYRRLEIEQPLGQSNIPAVIGELPAPLADALAGIAGERESLCVVCVLDQTRMVRQISSESPVRRQEMQPHLALQYLDEVAIHRYADAPILARTYEVEIELLPGVDLAELQVLADRYMGSHGLVLGQTSKLEGALSLIARHPADASENQLSPASKQHMGEACRIIWYEQFMSLLLAEAGIRYSSDPEYIHLARVSIRRARGAARIYKGFFVHKAIREFLEHLRHTAHLLGAVRDRDVAIVKLHNYQQKSKRRPAAELQATLDEWIAKRTHAHKALVEWFDSNTYGEFVARFVQFCRTPGEGVIDAVLVVGEPIPAVQVRHVVPSMLVANFERVRAFETYFEQADVVPLATLHQLRIACKYLRYHLEFVSGLLSDESSAIVAALRKLQDDLGDLNDAVVSKQLLAEGNGGANTATVARYQQAQDKTIAKLSRQTRDDFLRFVGQENRERLLYAIAHL